MPVPGAVANPDMLTTTSLVLDGPDGGFELFAAWPKAGDRLPGVLVIHEAYGVNDHIRDVCRRFAAQGFVSAAPDLFSHVGGPPQPGDMDAVMSRLAEMDDRTTLADLFMAAAWVRGHDRCSGRVGAVGFCMGGRLALLLATHEGVLDAAVDCWGGRTTRRTAVVDERHPEVAVERVDRLQCPLLGIFGAEDRNPDAADVAELRAALEEHGREHRIVVYPDAGHALFADYRPTYREAAAHGAWEEMLAWLGRLRG